MADDIHYIYLGVSFFGVVFLILLILILKRLWNIGSETHKKLDEISNGLDQLASTIRGCRDDVLYFFDEPTDRFDEPTDRPDALVAEMEQLLGRRRRKRT